MELISPGGIASGSGGRLDAADSLTQGLARAVSTAIRNYCGWHVAPVITETKTFDGTGSKLLQLRTMKLQDIESITINGTDVTDYVTWSELGSIRYENGFPETYRSVVVTYTHGFLLEDVADLVVIGEQIGRMAASSPMGALQESLGARSVTLAQLSPGVAGGLTLLQRDKDILDRYQLEKAL